MKFKYPPTDFHLSTSSHQIKISRFSVHTTDNSSRSIITLFDLSFAKITTMPSQKTPTPIALPIPRRRSPLLTNQTFGQDVTLYLSNTFNTMAKSPYTFITRDCENDYTPPAPPPPSPVNFPSESWSTACAIRR